MGRRSDLQVLHLKADKYVMWLQVLPIAVSIAGFLLTLVQSSLLGEERARRLAERELALASAVSSRSLARDLRASAHARLRRMLTARDARTERGEAIRSTAVLVAVLGGTWAFVVLYQSPIPVWLQWVYVVLMLAYVLLIFAGLGWIAVTHRRVRRLEATDG